jgi:hypothetical protein
MPSYSAADKLLLKRFGTRVAVRWLRVFSRLSIVSAVVIWFGLAAVMSTVIPENKLLLSVRHLTELSVALAWIAAASTIGLRWLIGGRS